MINASGPGLTQRVYERLCLTSAVVVALVVVPANLLQRMPWQVDAISAAFGIVSLWLHRLARRGRMYPGAFLFGMVISITLAWFPNAGAIGSIPFFFLPAVTYGAIFFRGRRRIAIVTLIVLDALALMAIESFFPQFIIPFVDPASMRADLAIGLSMSALMTALMLWIVTDGYDYERKSREATLRALDEAREEFARLFQMNPDAVYLVDIELPAFVDVNEGFERLTGWSKVHVVGRNATELKLWVIAEERAKFYDALSRRDVVQAFVSRFRRRDHSEFWGSTSASWVEMSGRRLLLLTTRDVTMRIEAQRNEAAARAALAALINSTSDSVWQVDPVRFALTAFNEAFDERCRKQFGKPAEIGKTLSDYGPPDAVRMWHAYFARALAEGPFTAEYESMDGRSMLVSFSPVRHAGEVFGISVFSRDISSLKRAADERAAMELQLLQSQKMESLGSLAGGVAHDFNNMLAAIMGYADMLLANEYDHDKRAALDAIMQASARSRDLTSKLLAFGRRGKNIVQAVDMAVIVRDAMDIVRPTVNANVAATVDMRGTWTIDGDPSQMTQVVLNLCINANEAMTNGGSLRITSSDESLDDASARSLGLAAGDYVRMRVVDSGVGMTPDVRARIFEPFFTTKVGGQVRGTGLGLSTVYGIIQSHGGNITAASAPGAGAVFTIYLPKGALQLERLVETQTVAKGTGVILIAEDEPMVRRLLVAAIEGLGYRVLAAEDGEDAVAAFAMHRGEITGVILDLKMPRKGGREAFIEMHEIDPTVPVLICSGYGDNEEAQSTITLGAKGLLAKPFRLADLSAHLAALGATRPIRH